MVPARGPWAQTQSGFLLFFLPENEPPSPLVSGIIDYNMPLTSTYLKQMKLRVMNSQEQVRRHVPSPGPEACEPAWMWLVLSKVWGHSVCKHTGSQRGPYLVIRALPSRLRGEERMCSWLGVRLGRPPYEVLSETREAHASLNSPQGHGGRGVCLSCRPWLFGCSLSALPFVCNVAHLFPPGR